MSSTESQEPLRILLTIHHSLELNSGAPGSTLQIAKALQALGHDVSVVGFNSMHRQWQPKLAPLIFPFRLGVDLMRPQHRNLVDVVDASTGDLWTLPHSFIAKSSRVFVTRSHGLEHLDHLQNIQAEREGNLVLRRRYFVYHGGLRLRQVARSLQIADAVIFLNDHERKWAIDHLGLSPGRTTVSRNGLSSELLGLPAPRPFAQFDTTRIAVLGAFLVRKGAATAAAVLSRLLRDHADYGASWFGAEPEAVYAALGPGLSDRVNVLPRYERADLPRLLAGHQVLLFLSRFEGFGNALLEAMACGLVGVASDIPGPSDIIRHGGGGVLVPPGDVIRITRSVESLLSDRGKLDRIRNQAYQSAQRFTWDDNASRRVSLYRTLLAQKRVAPQC